MSSQREKRQIPHTVLYVTEAGAVQSRYPVIIPDYFSHLKSKQEMLGQNIVLNAQSVGRIQVY